MLRGPPSVIVEIPVFKNIKKERKKETITSAFLAQLWFNPGTENERIGFVKDKEKMEQ